MPSQDLVLITGATGHIGFRTLIFALQAGYHVRAAIRSPDKADRILSNPTLKSLKLPAHALSFVTVPDLTAPGAYDEAVVGVSHIIHIASPLVGNNLSRSPAEADEVFIRPAVQGTLAMLTAAKTQPSVRRLVITSSVVATIPPQFWIGAATPPEGAVFSAADRVPTPHPPYPSLPAAYAASKVTALNETEAWVAREKPGFAVVTVHPGFVLGPDLLQLTAEESRRGTNMMALSLALGAKGDMPRAGSAVHVDDVARVQVGALDEEKVKVKGIRAFVTNVPAVWEDVVEIVKSNFGTALEKGVLKDDAKQPTVRLDFDARETEEVFGFKFVDFEGQVRSVIERYLELLGDA